MEDQPKCPACSSIELAQLRPGLSWFVHPAGKGRGLLTVGPGGATQCRGCGKVEGDITFVEMNRAQIRAAEANARKRKG